MSQAGDFNTWGGRGYVAQLQSAAGGGQPQSLHNQVTNQACHIKAAQQILFLKVFFNTFAFWTPKCTVNGIHFHSSLRKVQTESSTGSVGSSRVRTTLTLCVETVDFDSQACQLRVKGTNIEENQYVKVRNIWSVCYLGPRHIHVYYSHVHVLFGTGYTDLITKLFAKCSTICKCLWGLKLLTKMCKCIFNSKKKKYAFADCVTHLQIVLQQRVMLPHFIRFNNTWLIILH